VRKALAAFAIVALLFVMAGCPGGQKVKDLEAQVETQQQTISELEGKVQTLTVEKDSLQKVIVELEKKVPAKSGGAVKPPIQKGGTKPGTLKPPTQK